MGRRSPQLRLHCGTNSVQFRRQTTSLSLNLTLLNSLLINYSGWPLVENSKKDNNNYHELPFYQLSRGFPVFFVELML